MGCINGKSLLREEDLNYIARNTAMDKVAVEVSFRIWKFDGKNVFPSKFVSKIFCSLFPSIFVCFVNIEKQLSNKLSCLSIITKQKKEAFT